MEIIHAYKTLIGRHTAKIQQLRRCSVDTDINSHIKINKENVPGDSNQAPDRS